MKSRHRFATPRQPAPQLIDGNFMPSVEPAFTLDRQIASARKDMGEKRWSELNGEWA